MKARRGLEQGQKTHRPTNRRKTTMKIKVLNKTKVVLFASLLLATCLFAGTVNAQSFQGKFTLHHTARGGQAVIPAGEYRFTMDPGAEPALVVIYDANNGR